MMAWVFLQISWNLGRKMGLTSLTSKTNHWKPEACGIQPYFCQLPVQSFSSDRFLLLQILTVLDWKESGSVTLFLPSLFVSSPLSRHVTLCCAPAFRNVSGSQVSRISRTHIVQMTVMAKNTHCRIVEKQWIGLQILQIFTVSFDCCSSVLTLIIGSKSKKHIANFCINKGSALYFFL